MEPTQNHNMTISKKFEAENISEFAAQTLQLLQHVMADQIKLH